MLQRGTVLIVGVLLSAGCGSAERARRPKP
jgi:hypothetical protein